MRYSCLCLCWVMRWGTMLANFHMYGIVLLLRAVLNILGIPIGPMCFRCLMFSLSGSWEFIFLLCFIAYWTYVVVSVMLYPCICCVALLMDMFVLCVACLTVFHQSIHNVCGCGCYFFAECYGGVECGCGCG